MSDDSMTKTVERLRESKANHEASKATAQEKQLKRDQEERENGRQAGREWAAEKAEHRELSELSRLSKSPHPNHKITLLGIVTQAATTKPHNFADGVFLERSPSFIAGFIEGSLETWEQVKDQI